MGKIIYDNSETKIIDNGNGTCTKLALTDIKRSELKLEAEILKKLDGNIGPKFYSFNGEELVMEYIKGITLEGYFKENKCIPDFFFPELVKNSIILIKKYQIYDYSDHEKFFDHYIIDKNNKVRFVDFGQYTKIRDEFIRGEIDDLKKKYAFLFKEYSKDIRKQSIEDLKIDLAGIPDDVINSCLGRE